jgi:hypothetical protein
LASGKVTTGALSGVVLCSPEGALDLSYCWGVWGSANARPDVMISAELAEITNRFLNGVSSSLGSEETRWELVGFHNCCGSK